MNVYKMQNPFIIGKQLYLRPLEAEQDYMYLATWASSEEMRRYFNVYPISNTLYKDRVHNFYKDNRHIPLGVVEQESHALVGVVGLKDINYIHRMAEFYIKIDPAHQGKGYGTEATRLMLRYGFVDLNLNRIQTQDVDINIPGWKVDEKLGFQFEGIIRESYMRAGTAYNVRLYSILRQEYLNLVMHDPQYKDEQPFVIDVMVSLDQPLQSLS